MEESSLIVAGGLVFTCDGANTAGPLSLLLRDGRIADIAPSAAALRAQHPQAGVVDASDRIILPGFVNAHYHCESFVLRTLTGRRAFASWPSRAPFRDGVEMLTRSAPEAALESLYAVAGAFHLRHGTTCVGDFPLPYPASRLDAARTGFARAGIRHAVVLQTWDQIDAALNPDRPDDRMLLVSLGKTDDITLYSLENHLRVSRERRIPLCVHGGETPGEVERFRRNFKRAPLAVLKEYGALTGGTQVIHGNHLGPADVAALRSADATLTLCPLSASFKRTGYPLLSRLSGTDVRMCIGTDWGGVDVMAEIRFLRMLPNLAGGVRQYSAVELLRMATINGAHALGLGGQTGSLEIGKRADMVFFSPELAGPEAGRRDVAAEGIAAMVVDYLDRGAITDVLVDGRFVIREGRRVPGEMKEQRDACGALFDSLSGRPAAAEDPSRRGPPLLPETREGFLAGFRTPPAEDAPVSSGGRNASEPAASGPDAKQKIQKIFGENDY